MTDIVISSCERAMSSCRSGTDPNFGAGPGAIGASEGAGACAGTCADDGEGERSAATTFSRSSVAYACRAASAFLKGKVTHQVNSGCLLYTSDAADDLL